MIDPLATYGQVLMGLCLYFGAFTRLTLFFAAVMMFLFYIPQFPPKHDLFVDYYIVAYAMLGALGAGRVLGADRLLERLPAVRNHPKLKLLLG